MQQQDWVDYRVQTRNTDDHIAVRSRHTFLEVFNGDAERTSTATIHRSSSEPRKLGGSTVEHDLRRPTPDRVLGSEFECSGPDQKQEESAPPVMIHWPTMTAAQVDEVNSDNDASDSDWGSGIWTSDASVDTSTSHGSMSSGTFMTGKQRKSKLRPCKGKRARYRKLVTRLVEQHKNAPERFDIASAQLPPSISSPDQVAKLEKKVRDKLSEDSAFASSSVPQASFAEGSDAASSRDALPASGAMAPPQQLAHTRGPMSHGSEAPAGETGNEHFDDFEAFRGSVGRQGAQSGEGHRDVPADGGMKQPSRARRGELLYHQGNRLEGQTQGLVFSQGAQPHAGPGMQQSQGENVSLQGKDGMGVPLFHSFSGNRIAGPDGSEGARMLISLSNSFSGNRSAAPRGYDVESGTSHWPPVSRHPLQPPGHAGPSGSQAPAATEGYGVQGGIFRRPAFSTHQQQPPAAPGGYNSQGGAMFLSNQSQPPTAPGRDFMQGDALRGSAILRPHLQPSGVYNFQGGMSSLANQSQHLAAPGGHIMRGNTLMGSEVLRQLPLLSSTPGGYNVQGTLLQYSNQSPTLATGGGYDMQRSIVQSPGVSRHTTHPPGVSTPDVSPRYRGEIPSQAFSHPPGNFSSTAPGGIPHPMYYQEWPL